MERFFNTAGPIIPEDHYHIPSLQRWDLEEILSLIDQKRYFVLHAPRQTGKTSCLLALMELLNAQEPYASLYVNIEPAQTARNDVDRGIRTVMGRIAYSAEFYLKDKRFHKWVKEIKDSESGDNMLTALLQQWSSHSDQPIVLMLDEIDALMGDTLVSVLRQVRAGYSQRPGAFPQSVILCGVRDVRDYRIHTSNNEIITGGSAFNIKAESLRLGNFSQKEIALLLEQHTEQTGQAFEEGILEYFWQQTDGQPWLVNALAYQACFKDKASRDRSQVITLEKMQQVREELIQRRDTHLDQLVDKLQEPRVHSVIAPILQNESLDVLPKPDDLQYVMDLGLVKKEKGVIGIANKIYQEIIPRELTYMTQIRFGPDYQPEWYITQKHKLDMAKLLKAFQEFFREHSESWVEGLDYKEAGPQLLLQAFLQRIINGGGRIDREYSLGRQRTDLFIQWPIDQEKGFSGSVQKVVIELKILHKAVEATFQLGLEQTAGYMDRCGAEEGHLIIFDRDKQKSWEEKVYQRVEEYGGKSVCVWGM